MVWRCSAARNEKKSEKIVCSWQSVTCTWNRFGSSEGCRDHIAHNQRCWVTGPGLNQLRFLGSCKSQSNASRAGVTATTPVSESWHVHLPGCRCRSMSYPYTSSYTAHIGPPPNVDLGRQQDRRGWVNKKPASSPVTLTHPSPKLQELFSP